MLKLLFKDKKEIHGVALIQSYGFIQRISISLISTFLFALFLVSTIRICFSSAS